MPLKRAYDYTVTSEDARTINVRTFEGLKTVQIAQDGGHRSEHDETVCVSFDQLPALIQALEEIRTHHVPREWTAD
jgi:hypothetical protein